MNNKNIMIINNTGKNLDDFHSAFIAVAKGEELAEEIADIFSAEVIYDNGMIKVIVDWF